MVHNEELTDLLMRMLTVAHTHTHHVAEISQLMVGQTLKSP